MSWPAYLDHLEEILEVAERRLAEGDLLQSAAIVRCLADRGPGEGLPPLPEEHAGRARDAVARLDAATAQTRAELQRLRPELDLLAAAHPAPRGAVFVDHRG